MFKKARSFVERIYGRFLLWSFPWQRGMVIRHFDKLFVILDVQIGKHVDLYYTINVLTENGKVEVWHIWGIDLMDLWAENKKSPPNERPFKSLYEVVKL